MLSTRTVPWSNIQVVTADRIALKDGTSWQSGAIPGKSGAEAVNQLKTAPSKGRL